MCETPENIAVLAKNVLKSLSAEFLSKSETSEGETFHQYTWTHICIKSRPGQNFIFGIHLLKDSELVRQILRSPSGPDAITSQLINVGEQWISQRSPSWGQLLAALKKDEYMNELCINITDGMAGRLIGIEDAVTLQSFTDLVVENDALPVYDVGGVEMFGTVILGLKRKIVRQCIPTVVDNNHPQAVAHMLEEWVERHPKATACDLVDAMYKAKYTNSCVKEFEVFLMSQDFTTVTPTLKAGITDSMGKLVQEKVNKYYREKLKICAHAVSETNPVDFEILFTDLNVAYLPNAYDHTTTASCHQASVL